MQAATYSVGVAEACVDGDPVIRFTNTGTGHIYANIGMAARAVAPGATYDAFWPMAHGDLYPSFEWAAYELPDPAGQPGDQPFASGEVQLLDACGTFYAAGVELHCAEGDAGRMSP